ncbi:MAG: zf-TFIIB domain-containing protein [Bacteroidetes bacterium]|nr:zf-TFIIB domain-containing protein [Bacteroidota bacterium]
MKCPNCNDTLLMYERNNIEIDYCPACRGIWLDKGELDKFIEFASQNSEYPTPLQSRETKGAFTPTAHHYSNQHRAHKKKSIFGDLFDFD